MALCSSGAQRITAQTIKGILISVLLVIQTISIARNDRTAWLKRIRYGDSFYSLRWDL
jgi:hypothetical protein